MVPYIQSEAFGIVNRLLSIICCPTLTISTTPMRTTRDVVFIIRVTKLIDWGINRLRICGMTI